MDGLQITIGAAKAASRWWDLIIPGLFALGGVAITNWVVIQHRKADAKERHAERSEAAKALRELDAERRGVAAVALAEHLETFVLRCHDVVDSYGNGTWMTPMDWESPGGYSPLYFSALPEWPADIDWLLLGVATKVEASNFKRLSELMDLRLDDMRSFFLPEEYHDESAYQAAQMLLEAWAMATKLRVKHNLSPMKLPAGWDLTSAPMKLISTRHWAEVRNRELAEAMSASPQGTSAPPEAV